MANKELDHNALKRLLHVIGGDTEDLCELIEDFIETSPEISEKIAIAGSSGDWDTMRINAHTLKSNARDFGATRLAELCESLEKKLHSGAIDAPEAVSAEIIALQESACVDLQALDAEQFSEL